MNINEAIKNYKKAQEANTAAVKAYNEAQEASRAAWDLVPFKKRLEKFKSFYTSLTFGKYFLFKKTMPIIDTNPIIKNIIV